MAVSVSPASRLEDRLHTFELALAGLVDGVSQFHPNNGLAEKVISAEKNLSLAIEELMEHQRLGKEHQKLLKESERLDKDITKVLVGLSDCRRKLQPTQGQVGGASTTKEDGTKTKKVLVDELLAYATKITKFTHAPPGYNPELAENANFPWPSEDELRRGVVAMLSTIEPPKLDEAGQVGSTEAAGKPNGEESTSKSDAAEVENHNFSRTGRRSSLVSYGERPTINASSPSNSIPEGQESNKLELDFFDPDEDDE